MKYEIYFHDEELTFVQPSNFHLSNCAAVVAKRVKCIYPPLTFAVNPWKYHTIFCRNTKLVNMGVVQTYPEVRGEANVGKDKAEWSPLMTNSKQDF